MNLSTNKTIIAITITKKHAMAANAISPDKGIISPGSTIYASPPANPTVNVASIIRAKPTSVRITPIHSGLISNGILGTAT